MGAAPYARRLNNTPARACRLHDRAVHVHEDARRAGSFATRTQGAQLSTTCWWRTRSISKPRMWTSSATSTATSRSSTASSDARRGHRTLFWSSHTVTVTVTVINKWRRHRFLGVRCLLRSRAQILNNQLKGADRLYSCEAPSRGDATCSATSAFNPYVSCACWEARQEAQNGLVPLDRLVPIALEPATRGCGDVAVVFNYHASIQELAVPTAVQHPYGDQMLAGTLLYAG